MHLIWRKIKICFYSFICTCMVVIRKRNTNLQQFLSHNFVLANPLHHEITLLPVLIFLVMNSSNLSMIEMEWLDEIWKTGFYNKKIVEQDYETWFNIEVVLICYRFPWHSLSANKVQIINVTFLDILCSLVGTYSLIWWF